MDEYLYLFVMSFFISSLSTPLIIKLSFWKNYLDYPLNDPLKIHKIPIPTLGGMAILIAVLITSLFGSLFIKSDVHQLTGVVIGCLIIYTIGLLDDIKNLKPIDRLFAHIVAALILVLLNNYKIMIISNDFIGMTISVLYIVVCINAINLIDGIDGLAAGIAFVASFSFFIAFSISGNIFGVTISLILLGASAGFLLYNFSPAIIFLGDNGSTVLGFLLGTLAILYSSVDSTSYRQLVFPIFVLIVPIFDTAFAIIRRLKSKVPITHGDRNHLYDYLIKKGISPRMTMIIMCFVGLIGSLIGFLII